FFITRNFGLQKVKQRINLFIFLEKIHFFVYLPETLSVTEAVGYRLLAAFVSGILLGVCVGIMLKIGYSSGGVDIIACLVHKWKPHINVERIISICAYSIVGLSFFVYHDLTSIFLSAVQIFVSERIVAAFLKGERFAVEVKIVTKEPRAIRDEILYKHKHSATVVKSQGMYSGEDNYVILSVMNIKEIPDFMNTMKRYPEAFVYFSDGVRVQGDFHFNEEEIGRWLPAFK
ncbi:MAG: YitT family protein, partial [Clostridia bacterium]|nr:YitT family protein [Clostridia bacterium]